MREVTPPIRVSSDDLRTVPLLHRADRRNFWPRLGYCWAVVVLEEGDTFEPWQLGARVWAEILESHDPAAAFDSTEIDGRSLYINVSALDRQESLLAERAFFWRIAQQQRKHHD